MIIGIDIRVLEEGSGGIFEYAKNLLRHLLPLTGEHQVKLFVNKFGGYKNQAARDLLKYPNVKIYSYKLPNKLLNFSFRFFNFPQIDTMMQGVDVLFIPSMLYGCWSKNSKTVLTMHDLSFEIYPEFFTGRQNLWHQLMRVRPLCGRVDKIIAVSENTKQDLRSLYNLPSAKIKTIHSGYDKSFVVISDQVKLNAIKQKYSLPLNRKFILQTGTFEPRKNYLATIHAFDIWQKNFKLEARDYDLLLVGHQGWQNEEIWKTIENSRAADKIHALMDVEPADLPPLYNLADIFVYPSFYEGFGFPVLEAMACGVPIITSHSSSLPELAATAGLLVNPHRVDDLIAAIQALVNDKSLYGSLRELGLAQANQFSWEETARKTLNLIESV